MPWTDLRSVDLSIVVTSNCYCYCVYFVSILREYCRYLFGEIMYGGHIVNNLDRLLAKTYLGQLIQLHLLNFGHR